MRSGSSRRGGIAIPVRWNSRRFPPPGSGYSGSDGNCFSGILCLKEGC